MGVQKVEYLWVYGEKGEGEVLRLASLKKAVP